MKKTMLVALFGLGLLSSNLLFAAEGSQSASMAQNDNNQTQAGKNLSAGKSFLEANKNKPGVVALPDGLQYKVLVKGTGAKPTDADQVTVDYIGTFINGNEFDSSYKTGQPVTFPVNGVIPGWTEALKLMSVGSTWELYIPPQLAYGENGAPPAIGPNETLVFKVKLLGINQ